MIHNFQRNLMDNKLQQARGSIEVSMKPEFYNRLVTLNPTINVSVCNLLLWSIWEKVLRSNLLVQRLSGYWQQSQSSFDRSLSMFVFSHCLIVSDENYSCNHLGHMRLLSRYCVPGSMLSVHGEASGSRWCPEPEVQRA